ncbi:MAG TPA: cupin domain-containing protein [Thermoplasmata archaeon]|jgi:mannose-6-phosphate isomerase-like protein (cupin superfamily)|nr:cupin domain-containing protein [Thermoplasmata archaeon]
MDRGSLERAAARARDSGRPYVELLRVPSMSAGVCVFAVGSIDRQSPHAEDEVYFVVRGRGRFRQGREDRPVTAGDFLFVPAREVHSFHEVEEELVVVVFFAPAESPGA